MSAPTPRTDEQINGKPCTRFCVLAGDSLRDALVQSDFARTLERELNESRNAERLARVQLGAEREKVRVLREEFTPRIAQYLGNGGLFNPELMDAHQTSLLLRDIRDAIDAAMKRGTK